MANETNGQALQTTRQSELQKFKALAPESFERAIAYFESDLRPLPSTRLLPADVCVRVIAMCRNESVMTEVDCVKASSSLMAGYVGVTVNMPEADKLALMRAFEKVFAAYPRYAALIVCDPAKGLPSHLQFTPKPADLVAALDAQVTKRRSYAVKAQWHIDEGIRRAKQEELDSACSKLSPEAKAALVSRAFARIKPMSDDQPHTTQDKAMNRQFEIQLKSKMEAQ